MRMLLDIVFAGVALFLVILLVTTLAGVAYELGRALFRRRP